MVLKVRDLKIWISQSKCIYENLALENCLFQSENFTNSDGLLVWRNRPAMVIGRFQNPWLEGNVDYCNSEKIDIARRLSGGGTVFHDLGNINFSILTSKSRHNRCANLRLIAETVRNRWNINVELNKRQDLVIGEKKISGTAAKIGRDTAYHHFTLLVHSQPTVMRKVLQSPLINVETNASKSVKSSVGTLSDEKTDLDTENVIQEVVDAFKSQYEHVSEVHLQPIEDVKDCRTEVNRLKSWDWIFGSTPPFTIPLPDLGVKIKVEDGRISEIQGSDCVHLEGKTFTIDKLAEVVKHV